VTVTSPPGIAPIALGLVLVIATTTDVRRREVPLWLTLGAIGSGIALSAIRGPDQLGLSLVGFLVGIIPAIPFVLVGGLGAADALLLAGVGVWEGWRFVLAALWWTALAGAALALIARRREQHSFAYVPATAFGTVVAYLLS